MPTRVMLKQSNAPGDSTDNFEAGMAQLSRQALQNRSPLAAKAEVGFQLLDKNDEGDSAVGVFGLRLGKQMAYAPAFFLNGEIITDHLYLLGRDQFVPLSDKWVQAVSKGQFSSMGRQVSRSQTARGLGYADLTPLLRTVYKSGKAGLPVDFMGGLPEFAKAASNLPEALPPLRDTLRKLGASAYKNFGKFSSQHPSFLKMVDKVYGEGTVDQIIDDARKTIKFGALGMVPPIDPMVQPIQGNLPPQIQAPAQLAPAPMPPGPPPISPYLQNIEDSFSQWSMQNPSAPAPIQPGFADAQQPGDMSAEMSEKMGIRRGKIGPLEEFVEGASARKPRKRLTVTTAPEVIKAQEIGITLPDGVRKAAATQGIAVVDARGDDEFAIAIKKTKAYEAWHNPSTSGIFQVIMPDGQTKRCAVFMPEQGQTIRSSFCLVVDLDGKDFFRGSNLKVIAEERDRKEAEDELKSWFNGLSDGSLTSRGNAAYTAITEQLAYACPFNVGSEDDTGAFTAYWQHLPNNDEEKARKDVDRSHDPEAYDSGCSFAVRKSAVNGARIGWIEKELVIPSSAKIVKLGSPMRLGNQQAFDNRLTKHATRLTLQRTGHSRVAANGFELDDRDMALHLAHNWSLPYKQACEMVKESETRGVQYHVLPSPLMIKAAFGPFGDQEAGMVPTPALPNEERFGTMALRDGRSVPVDYGNEQMVRTSPAVAQPPRHHDGDGIGPFEMMGMEDMDRAQQGGRELFDVAALSPLMDAESMNTMVDDGMSELFKGLNRILSYLFSLYRRNEQFVERYGEQDAKQLRESLRTTAEKTGDLILAMKQKSVDTLPTPNPGDLVGD
jgi:hypothetical protein